MQTEPNMDPATAIERLTGVKVDLEDDAIKGRNVWGRVAFNRGGIVHVEVRPGDEAVNDAVMPTVTKDDMQFGRERRREIYRDRCREAAASMNARAIGDNKLILLVASNGHLTRTAKALIEALL